MLKNILIFLIVAVVAYFLYKQQVEKFGPNEENASPFPYSNPMGQNGVNLYNADIEATPKDLLPNVQDLSDFDTQFTAAQGILDDKNFLVAGYNIGINTSNGSRRNGSQDLRSEPKNPRFVISPWNESTIVSDFSHRSFEIGENLCA